LLAALVSIVKIIKIMFKKFKIEHKLTIFNFLLGRWGTGDLFKLDNSQTNNRLTGNRPTRFHL